MINLLPIRHNDELLYSIIGRYHEYSGNLSLKTTLKELFNTINIVPTVEFQSHLKEFVKNIEYIGISEEDLIRKNSLMPLYFYFMQDKDIKKIKKILINSDGKSVKYKTGILAGGICRKKHIFYCPLCCKEELHIYRECYIHRTHQMEGVLVCEKHGCVLNEYPLNLASYRYITLEVDKIDFKVRYLESNLNRKLKQVAEDIYFLLNNKKYIFSIKDIKKKYNVLLYKKGLSNINGRVYQKKLHEEFISFHSTKLLSLLNSNLIFEDESNWLKCLVRKHKKIIHPLRHVLFIEFLCGSVEKFMKIKDSNIYREYGKALCLNPCCEDYGKAVINDYEIKFDSKSKKIIGTFKCKCGFTYSKNVEEGPYYIGKVICYGSVWEDKLKRLIQEGSSINAIAKEMRCDSGTVVKYADKLGVKNLLNTKRKISYRSDTKKYPSMDIKTEYRNSVSRLILNNSDISRKDVRRILNKEYIWLYRNDKEWFDRNMPKVNCSYNIKDYSQYWRKRDEEIFKLVKAAYETILNMKKPRRITKSLLGKIIMKKALLEKKIDKLPKTKELLDNICEDVDEFRFRRLDRVYDYIEKENIKLPEWKILRIAGINEKGILEKYKSYKLNVSVKDFTPSGSRLTLLEF